jgi:hypothetical protein
MEMLSTLIWSGHIVYLNCHTLAISIYSYYISVEKYHYCI